MEERHPPYAPNGFWRLAVGRASPIHHYASPDSWRLARRVDRALSITRCTVLGSPGAGLTRPTALRRYQTPFPAQSAG